MRIEVEGWEKGEGGARERKITLLVLSMIAVTCWVVILNFNDSLLDTSGLTRKEQMMASRIRQIARESGGDWQNVSPADRQFLTVEVSFGDEGSARMMLSASAGRLKGTRRPSPAPTRL
jgi:hypothetical protein